MYTFRRHLAPCLENISGLGLWANFMLKSAFALIGFKAYLWVIEEKFSESKSTSKLPH
ncbi:MAG: hypothetical protein Ct9H90mP14_2180 [Methanobacteriota archaeon]|nr:MAG: hypothetical protein Ct9H90mP14_2180 [Euryarchaeota archaeon]